MRALKNAWYCAGWGSEITREPLGRKILGNPVVMYRKENGDAVAIEDTCPHRFAPLHPGKVIGDSIECPYHGLRYDGTGACTLNPHDDTVNPANKVRSFPLIERHRAIWLWTGDVAKADPALVPDWSQIDDPAFRTFVGVFPVKGHYELMADNLLDQTHVRYLHDTFHAENSGVFEIETLQDGNVVTFVHNQIDSEKPAMLMRMWPDGPDRVDLLTTMTWNAPSCLVLNSCTTGTGQTREAGTLTIIANMITPETDLTCHYFYAFSRDYEIDNEEMDIPIRQGLETAVVQDDVAMVEMLQDRMGPTDDLMSLRPVILATDAAAIRARRILAKLIREEEAAAGNETRSVEAAA